MAVHEVSAPVVAVELLRSGAEVRRRGQLPVFGDDAEPAVELSGLPLALHDSSVRVELRPAGACRVIDIHVGLHLPPLPERTPVDKELMALRREQARLEQQHTDLVQRIDEILRLRPTLPPLPRGPGERRFRGEPIPAWLELADLLREAAGARQKRVRELERRLAEVGDALRRAEERLAAASSAQPSLGHLSKRLRVQLDRAPVAPPCLEVSYQVSGTRWYPSYELHIERGAARAELVMNALLAQRTGEDWAGVELILSTADRQRTCELPALPAWRIGRVRPDDARPAWRPLPADLEDLFRDFDRHRPAPLAPPPASGIELPGRAPLADHSSTATTAIMKIGDLEGRPAEDESYPAQGDRRWSADRDELGVVATAGEVAREPRPEPAGEAESTEAEEAVEVEGTAFISNELLAGIPAHEAPLGQAGPRPPAVTRHTEVTTEMARPNAPSALAVGAPTDVPAPQAPPAEALLSYGQLVMAAPEEGSRGRLRLPRAVESAGSPDSGADSALGLASFERFRELADLECLDLPVGVISVDESAGPFAYRYQTRLGAPVPSDGQLHRVAVLRAEVPVSLFYRTLPRLDPSVFRLARFNNPLDRPLLAGPLDVFWDGDYLITTQLKTTPAGAGIESALGIEPCVRVARNVHHSQREGGILVGRTVCEEEITIELESHLENESAVEVIERLPVSEDRKLEIKVSEESPAAEPYEQKERGHPVRGGRRWRLSLAPHRPQRLLLRYQIVLPSKSEVAGGGRRA